MSTEGEPGIGESLGTLLLSCARNMEEALGWAEALVAG